MSEQKIYGPCSEKQRLVLTENSVDILLTGGGAGGGKTNCALMKALSYVEHPHAKVLIMRNSYPLLKAIGGLAESAREMYDDFGAKYKVQGLEFIFPSKSMVKLVATPDDLKEVQGWQPTHVLFDEATEASMAAILALQARIRSAKYKGPKMSMMLTCNPDRNSWLYSWIEYSLDPNTGVPMPGTENKVRWFVNIAGKMYWADSEQELWEKHGHGLERGKTFIPLSFKFIPLTIDDNPALDKAMPAYRASLLAQSRVNQLRFLHGSWTAIPEGSSVFNRNWVKIVDEPPVNPARKVRSWDLAYSVPSEVYPDPDWTAGVLMSRTVYGKYCIENVKRDRKLTDGVVKMIIDTSTQIDGTDILVTAPRDNGGGKAASAFFFGLFAEAGMTARGIPITNQSSKMQRFLPFCTLAEAGLVTIVRGDWNEDWFTELEYFSGSRNCKDDQVDATADAFNTLAKQVTIPSICVPNLSQASPVPRLQ
jgi:predicted phage terminase large subunit-like protein